MKRLCTLSKPLAAAFLFCVALDASSLTLGRVRGAVLLGQPLNVTVALQPGADEEAGAGCLSASVAYGDTPLAPSQITVSAQDGPDRSTVARIYAHASVTEPVVTVQLQAGCGYKALRTYVLFADLAGDSVSGAGPAPSYFPAVPLAVPDDSKVPKGSAWDAPVRTTVPPAARGAVAVLPIPPALRAKPARPKAKPAPSATDSTLKLVPPVSEQPPTLKSSPQLPAAPIEDLQKRVDAIAQWKALTLTPEEVQKNAARVQSLEADLQALQAVTAKNQQNVQSLANALERAESERYANPLVYALVFLLAGVLAIAAYVAQKSKNAGANAAPWWGNAAATANPGLGGADAAGRSVAMPDTVAPLPARPDAAAAPRTPVMPRQTSTSAVPAAVQPAAARSSTVVDVDIALGDSLFTDLDTTVAGVTSKPAQEVKRTDKRDFAPSGSATLRSLNTKEMLDVRQQAEFFMALGQHDEATKVLESSINESAEANPLVYLDLLRLLHTLSRRAEFDRYRDDFNLQFTGLVPGYPSFLMEGNALENYAEICNQIVALWPSDDAMAYIETCLVRQPQDDPQQGFDLQAFRDLLTLHGVLRRLDTEMDSAMVPFSASRMGQASLLSALRGDASTAYDEQLDIATAPLPAIAHSPDLGAGAVDLDLSSPASNLIDFDIQGLGVPTKPDSTAG